MGYCCENCGDNEHTCTGWDGKGINFAVGDQPNHNLVKHCPKDISHCKYRKEKIKSKPIKA